jgi:3-hydroxyacyl-CoA dehydrogenase
MSKLSFEVLSGIAVLKLDNPPVNSLGHELRKALLAGLEQADTDAGIEALVLIGSGLGFSGGADIREFGTPNSSAQPNLLMLIRAIEGCAKPVLVQRGRFQSR